MKIPDTDSDSDGDDGDSDSSDGGIHSVMHDDIDHDDTGHGQSLMKADEDHEMISGLPEDKKKELKAKVAIFNAGHKTITAKKAPESDPDNDSDDDDDSAETTAAQIARFSSEIGDLTFQGIW